MLSLKILKICLFAVLCASACRFWQSKPSVSAAPPTPNAAVELKSEIPFATKEPEIYQAEIHITANNAETIIVTARNGANRLTTYDYGKNSEIVLLQTGDGKSFTIDRRQKTYAENPTGGDSETDDIFPTAELLNQKSAASFESIGVENGLTVYRVILDASKSSEIVVTVDDKINLPVKQEFYSVAGERKTLVSTTELRNFTIQTDAGVFDLPKEYKKVSPTELQDILRRERTK